MKLVSRRAGVPGPGGGHLAVPPRIGGGSELDPETVEQQRRLVEELKSAQSILRRRRAQAEDGGQPTRLQSPPPPATQNGIHVDKPRARAADALSPKKPRSEPDAACDSTKVFYSFRCYRNCINILVPICKQWCG